MSFFQHFHFIYNIPLLSTDVMLMMTIYDDDDKVDVGNLPEGTDFKLEGRSFFFVILFNIF